MFERFTADARTTVAQAQHHARRLGHSHIGAEHLLLALVSGHSSAAAALREHRLTPQNVEEQILQAPGPGGGGGRRAGLDRDALAAIGIDLDQVSAVVDAAFGKDALRRAALSPATGNRGHLGHSTTRTLGRLFRRWHSRDRSSCGRAGHHVGARARPLATGRYRAAASGPAGHLPFTARAKQVLEDSLRQSTARGDGCIGAEHLALALVSVQDGAIPRMLSGLDISPAALIAAINDRYRQAG